MISGRSWASWSMAAAESWLPILLNIARKTMGFMLRTNLVMSSSDSLLWSGMGSSHLTSGSRSLLVQATRGWSQQIEGFSRPISADFHNATKTTPG